MNAPATRPFSNRPTTTAVVKPDQNRDSEVRVVERELATKLTQISSLLPPRLGDPKRFARMVVMACIRNEELLDCDRTSLYAAVMNCAELGLSCSGGPGGRAHLVPFEDKKQNKRIVTLIPDYKGLIDIALESGFYSGIEAHCVYTNDDFQVRLGTDSSIRHVPAFGDRGEIMGAYAVAYPKEGRPVFRYLTVDEIHHKRPAHTFNDSPKNPWNNSSAEMCCKTAVRALYKWLKTTPAMERVIDVEGASDAGEVAPLSMVPASAITAAPRPAAGAAQGDGDEQADDVPDFAAEAQGQAAPADDGAPPEVRRILGMIAAAQTLDALKECAKETAKLPDALQSELGRAYMEKKTAITRASK